MNLEQTASSIIEQFPTGEHRDLQKHERRLERFGTVAFTGLGIVIGIGILGLLYWVFDKVVLSGSDPLQGILLMAFIIFAALALAYVILQEILKEKRAKLRASPAQDTLLAQTTGKLLEESHFEPVPSVVEHTTELLAVKRDTKKLDQF